VQRPDEVAALHRTAATWLAGHGFGVEAVRQAQAARDWELGARLLADHWPGLVAGWAGGHHPRARGRVPRRGPRGGCELAAVAAADELAQGRWRRRSGTWRWRARARRRGADPSGRRGQAQLLLGVVRLLLAWYRGDLPAEAEQARRLPALFEAREAAQYDLAPAAGASRGEELRALALIGLGDTEIWTGRLDLAELHMEQAVALARRIGQPYLEFIGLAYQAVGELSRSFPRAAERGRQAIELAERHGWTDETTAGLAYMALGSALAWQGRAEEAEPWVQRAERTIRPEISPVSAMGVSTSAARSSWCAAGPPSAAAAFRAAERLAGQLPAPHPLAWPIRAWLVHALVRLDDPEQVLAGLGERVRDRGEIRIAVAVLRLAEDDPHAATAALAPVLDGSARVGWRSWLVEAFLLEAIARDALGDPSASGQAAERALDLAEADGALSWFLLHPAPGLLARQARQGHRARRPDRRDPRPPIGKHARAPGAGPRPLLDPLSKSELRVLRYLPTHLSAPEIAGELYVSPATVKTHLRNLYAKLGVHSRTDAVEAARALGLLAPSPQRG
jgi:LuxR family maltose regulon positive regulatory protein